MSDYLQLQDIHKDFSGLKVLTGVDFAVREKERHAVIGPNGAGKTTLFNIISGQFKASSGAILFKGQDISGSPPMPSIARAVAVIPDHQCLPGAVRLREHPLRRALPQRACGTTSSAAGHNRVINERTEAIADEVGLKAVLHMPVSALSYGQQRALEIASPFRPSPS